jgi:hypothetical protein
MFVQRLNGSVGDEVYASRVLLGVKSPLEHARPVPKVLACNDPLQERSNSTKKKVEFGYISTAGLNTVVVSVVS